jgi:hypothetical protein
MKNKNILLVISSLAVVGVLGYLLLKQQKMQKIKSQENPNITPTKEAPKLGFGTQFALDMEALRKQQIANRSIDEMRADFESTFTKKK